MSNQNVNIELFKDEDDYSENSLRLRWERYEPEPLKPLAHSDKWLLSSAMQKMIRRGVVEQAVTVAIGLHHIDPAYLRKRLPIIAMEDIGLGDVTVCFDVINVCSSSNWWGRNANRSVGFLVSSMARAIKSRAACDAFSWTEVHPDRSLLLPELLLSHENSLIDLACDEMKSQFERLMALRVLGGITINERGTYRMLSRCNIAALDAIGKGLKLPSIIRWLIACQRKTAGMAAMLPIAFEAAQNAVVRQGRDFPSAMVNCTGLPLCTLDMYTQLGRDALKRFYQSSDVLQDFSLSHVPRHNPQPLINLAMFQVESSLLDRFLSSPELDALKDASEEAEMRCMGMVDPVNRKQLYRLLEDSARVSRILCKRRLS